MSKQEAELAVYNTKFYPVGRRGMDFTGLSSDYMTAPVDKCVEHALENTFTMVQIEDVEALNQIDEIADTKGVDLLFIGPADLKQSAKAHGIFTEKFLFEAYKKVNEAVGKTQNTWWGTVTGSASDAEELFNMGCRFINIRGDFGAVYSGLSSLNDDVRKRI
jgi:2-keto-3-deoxy-L-rhamnonate aldolase RhmA